MMNCLPTDLSISKKVLLTGAGFTKDFGGFLATEMWDFIFNNPSLDNHPRIKNIPRHDFSYESVYHEVIENPKYDGDEKDTIKEAVKSAYDRLDESIRSYHNNKHRTANSTSLTSFIKRFHDTVNSRGFFFTLNQDLFVERYCRDANIITPGIELENIGQEMELRPSAYKRLPGEIKVSDDFREDCPVNPLRSNKLHYVKLHGSYNWRDSGGDVYMVIGKNKSEQISREPLLRRYSQLFQEILTAGNRELFVIGYGFGDEHINEVIADSIRDNGLKLNVMNPDAPEKFQEILSDRPHCENLWDSISKYYPYSISRVFPQNGKTIEHEQIMNNFFR